MTAHVGRAQLRQFGLMVGGIFVLIGLWPLIFRGQGARLWVLAIAGALIGPALVAPRTLAPVHRAWMALGDVLGAINTRIVLGLIFFVLITPLAVAMRLLGRDPMQRAFDPAATTYLVRRKQRPATHMHRQF